MLDTLTPTKRPLRRGIAHLAEDRDLLRRGILDWGSFRSGYTPAAHNVELVMRHANGEIYQVRRSHNLRTTMGRDQWQRLLMFGNITANATGYTGVTGTASSAPTATSLTNSTAAFPTTGGPNGSLQGQVVVCPVAGVYGTILSNTATVLTVDQWTSLTSSSGAAGTTPANGAAYAILPWAGPALWIGLSTNNTAPAAGDILRTADGLYGDGTGSGAATEQNANGLTRTFVQPTFPSAGQVQLQTVFTYTGASLVTVYKGVICNSKAAAGSLLFCDTLINASASFSLSGDNATLTWTFNL